MKCFIFPTKTQYLRSLATTETFICIVKYVFLLCYIFPYFSKFYIKAFQIYMEIERSIGYASCKCFFFLRIVPPTTPWTKIQYLWDYGNFNCLKKRTVYFLLLFIGEINNKHLWGYLSWIISFNSSTWCIKNGKYKFFFFRINRFSFI